MKKLLIITLLSITASSQAMFKGLSIQSARLATAAAFNLKPTRSLWYTQKVSDKCKDYKEGLSTAQLNVPEELKKIISGTQEIISDTQEVLSTTKKLISNYQEFEDVQNEIIRSMRRSLLVSFEIYTFKDRNDEENLMVSISRLDKETKHLNILIEKHE
ncbi:hypothetical protein K9K77_03120 [Candidatus Babeliales bacterium]|nr:hypothetical protein [Candidatus Babeliales bacterium]